MPNDADSPKFKTTVGSVKWVPENSEIVWSIKSFPVSTVLSGVPLQTSTHIPPAPCALAVVGYPPSLEMGHRARISTCSFWGSGGRGWRAEELAGQGGKAGAFWESRGWLGFVRPSPPSSSASVQCPLPPSFLPSRSLLSDTAVGIQLPWRGAGCLEARAALVSGIQLHACSTHWRGRLACVQDFEHLSLGFRG